MKIGINHNKVDLDTLDTEEVGYCPTSIFSVLDEDACNNHRKGKVVKKFMDVPPRADVGDCVDTDTFKYMEFPFKYFNPMQASFLPELNKNNNVIICGSTSAGKTVIAEQIMSYTLEEIRKTNPMAKVGYVSPLKALCSEKHDDWTNESHYFYKYNISILTGDYSLTQARKAELEKADIVSMSCEMLGSRIRRNKSEMNKWLIDDMFVIVFDESHLIGTSSRGPNLEAAIIKFSKVNPKCRLIFLSATMPNIEDIGAWLTKLNGKETSIIKSNYRPVDLKWNFDVFENNNYYWHNEKNKINKTIEITKKHPNDKFIIFVHGKKTGRLIKEKLEIDGEWVEFHNADLTKDKREHIQNSFRSRDPQSLRLLIATSGLSMGLNLPARRVIIVGIHRGINKVESRDVIQMGGRAGRIGLDECGDVHVLIGNENNEEEIKFCKEDQPAISKMADIHTLAFHIVSEIVEGNVITKEDANKWCSQSLANYQNLFVKDNDLPKDNINYDKTLPNFVYKVLDKLEEYKAIGRKKSNSEHYKALPIGRISSWFYLNPFDVSSWVLNFKTILVKDNPSDEDIAWALGNTFSSRSDYKMKLDDMGNYLMAKLNKKGRSCIGGVPKNVYAIYCLLKNINPTIPELNNLIMTYNMDSERITAALNVLDKTSGEFKELPGWIVILELPYRLRYGMGRKGIGLLMLPGIGKKTTDYLLKRGISTCKELVAAHAMNQPVLADNKWVKVKGVAEEIARIGYVAYLKKDKENNNI